MISQSTFANKSLTNYLNRNYLFQYMRKTSIVVFAMAASLAVVSIISATSVDALATSSQPHHSDVTMTPINDEIGVKKTTVVLSVPFDNTLPWGFVTGQPSDHVSDYPVIIQFHQDGHPVHFAQVDANEDGSYEYRFRVLSVDLETGYTTHIFKGQYDVSIFQVVPNTQTATVSAYETI